MSMVFTINNSPFFGKDGKFVTSRHIHDRLMKELDKNLALQDSKKRLILMFGPFTEEAFYIFRYLLKP